MKRSTLNLALLVVAAGLAVGVYLSREKEKKGPPLTPLTAAAVTRIAIDHPGSPKIELARQDGGWVLTAPVSARADDVEINGILALADRESKEQLDNAQLKLADLRLEPPDYTLTLNDTAIAFGTMEPLQYRRYVKVGDTVHLIEDPPAAALDADYADLVAKALVPEKAQITRIEVPGLTLAKNADGAWAVQPKDPQASADAMQKMADAWKTARSMWNERLVEKGVTPPAKHERARLTLADGQTADFVITERDPQFKLSRPDLGVTFVLSKALTEDMLKLPAPPPPDEPAAPEEKKE